jgi:hypothetical protein
VVGGAEAGAQHRREEVRHRAQVVQLPRAGVHHHPRAAAAAVGVDHLPQSLLATYPLEVEVQAATEKVAGNHSRSPLVRCLLAG